MAYRIPSKTQEDISARTALGISIPFSTLFNQTYTTRDATRNNLINYMLTNKGERPLNPLFGSDIRKKLFDPITQTVFAGLEIQIREEIETFFPLIDIENLSITANEDRNIINLNLTYSVLNSEIDEVNIDFNTEE
jgi:phage baseplate assembly protein W